MRSALVIVALACAASAAQAEDTRESRYGPTALRPSVSLTGSNYGGPVLGWAGKQDIAAPERAPAQVPALALRPMATPWRQLGAVPQQQQPVQQSYAASRPATTPPQGPQAPEPAAVAYAQSQVQAPVAQSPAQLQGQVQGSRTYSVGRQYGMTPDAIPPVSPNGMIFIAPSDEPKASKKDEEPRHGSVEWLAQAPMDAPETDGAKSGNN